MVYQALVYGHYVRCNIKVPIVSHDRIKHPEEAPRLPLSLALELKANLPNSFKSGSAWHVTRKHHIEVVKIRLFESPIQVRDFLRRYS
jgi:hypothetical protein